MGYYYIATKRKENGIHAPAALHGQKAITIGCLIFEIKFIIREYISI